MMEEMEKNELNADMVAAKPEKKSKTWVKIVCIILAVVLAIGTFAAVLVLPQLRKKGTRYDNVKDIANGDVLMIAHRGLSGLELENTNPAFIAAGEHDYYGIETDVHVTKDGKYIIAHDGDLQHIAGKDIEIAESTFAELRALRFKDPYGTSEEEVCYLPTLDEYLQICKQYNKEAVLEIKGDLTKEQLAEVVQIVRTYEWLNRTTFISFSQTDLLNVRAAAPDAKAQYIVQNVEKGDIEFMIENKIDANLCWISVNPFRVRKLHKAGLKVNVWTVDGRLCAWLAKLFGVDMITTNILV